MQSVVIPALRKCGSPPLTIFADADCATHTYQNQAYVLSNLGLRYRVVPVVMKRGFCFHPKAILLSGINTATLLVGSGNLTFGGWRENGEVWSRYDTDTDGTGVFSAFRSYMHDVVRLCAHSHDFIVTEIEEAFDSNTRTWAAKMEPAKQLLGRAGLGNSMIERMKSVFGNERAEHLYVCTPYFDDKAEALQQVAQELGVKSTTVLVQSKRTNLLETAAASLNADFKLKATTFKHKEKAASDDEEKSRETLLHAKFYAAQRENEVTVFVGSANCSRAALLIPGEVGNAELMSYFTLPKTEFKRIFLDELIVDDVVPELKTVSEEQVSENEETGFIHIHVACMETGYIRVAFDVDKDTKIISSKVDGVFLEPVDCGDDWVTFKTTQKPRMIELIGSKDGVEIRSLTHWIDNEYALRVSARGRSMVESINTKIRGDSWGIGAWTDVLSELYKHLQYMPKGAQRGAKNLSNDSREAVAVEFEWGDVFSDNYGLPIGSDLIDNFCPSKEGRIGGLRSMLLRWFGISQLEPDKNGDTENDDIPLTDITGSVDDGGDNVDTPTTLHKKTSQPTAEAASVSERKRALKLVYQVVSRLVEPDFLSERRPELLGADLKVVAVLLRAGLADEWLTAQDFFNATFRVWLPLFFAAISNENTGWLEQRFLTAPNQKEFAEEIRSTELAAALGCWALSMPTKTTCPEHVLFDLASTLSISRLPWLWQTGGNKNLTDEITAVFKYTSRGNIDWCDIRQRWITLVRRGYALNVLMKAISSLNATEVRSRIQQASIEAGELLWQGSKIGVCVAKQACNREIEQNCDVLILQKGNLIKKFSGPFLIPLSGLLEDGIFGDDKMPPQARNELLAMVNGLRVTT